MTPTNGHPSGEPSREAPPDARSPRPGIWWLLFVSAASGYSFGVEEYIAGDQGLWRTVGLIAVSVIFFAVFVVPLVGDAWAWQRDRSRRGG